MPIHLENRRVLVADDEILIADTLADLRVLLFSGKACTADLLSEARWRGHEFEPLSKPVHPKDLLAKFRVKTRQPQLDGQPITAPVRAARATE